MYVATPPTVISVSDTRPLAGLVSGSHSTRATVGGKFSIFMLVNRVILLEHTYMHTCMPV